MAGHLIGWLLHSVAKAPSENLRRLALEERRLPTNRTWIDLASAALPKAWEHCMNVQPSIDSDRGVHLPDSIGKATVMSNALSTTPSLEAGVHTDDSGEPTEGGNSRTLKARYRVGKAQDWVECRNATRLMLHIIEWCAQQHVYGADDYYKRLSRVTSHARPFLIKDVHWDRLPPQERKLYARQSVNGWRMFMNFSNKQKSEMIDKTLNICLREDSTHPVQGQDLWIEMPNAS